jgi:hypothetical protein
VCEAGHYASSMVHPRPFYYLENFCTALAWLRQRYGDLLNESEYGFIERFNELPRESAALLVRMIGRKGDLFRTAKLRYAEIGCPVAAAAPLIERGWVDCLPGLTIAELGRMLRKSELRDAFRMRGVVREAARGAAREPGSRARVRKAELIESLGVDPTAARTLTEWWPEAPDPIYRLVINPLCERLRLLFFGNFRQDWSEFVLTDLGIFKYEKVVCDAATRAFRTRAHIDTFEALFLCRKRLEEDGDLEAVLRALPKPVVDNEWLEGRRRKLQFHVAQCFERTGNLARALEIYRDCEYAGSRARVVRLLERLVRNAEAHQLASLIRERPADEVEAQQVTRMWPRLQRKCGLQSQRSTPSPGWVTFQLALAGPERPAQLEQSTGEALSEPGAPVYYVENGLLNSLFGLLCWDAIFAPVSGAFFHEFQAAPADLHAPQFQKRREAQFAQCFQQLGSSAYRDTICRNFSAKTDIQSPFVFWGVISQPLLSLALDCLPSAHLLACFQRILADIRANRTGLPDLVQFWPAQRRYRLIEVKGPGDRLQDNQIRWLRFCVANSIPVSVCHVSW